MQTIKWVIFDVGGVLLDWQTSSVALAEYLEIDQTILLDTMFEQAPKMNIGEISAEEGWRLILNKLSKDNNPRDIIRRWRHKDFWIKETLSLTRDLDDAGYKLAILSNSWLGLTDTVERDSFPPEINLFNIILDSSREGIRKPNPRFYELAGQKINADPSEILFIDDDGGNLPAAELLGWQTFHFVLGQDGGLTSNNKLRSKLLV